MLSSLQILLCAILWGFAGPFIRWSELPSLSIVAIRFTFPIFFAYLSLRFFEKKRLHPIDLAIAFVSFITAVGNAFYISSFTFTSISNVLLLLYTRPVMATLLACYLLGEHISIKLWSMLTLSFIGAMLIVTSHELRFSSADFIGMLLSLGAAFTTALAWAVIKKYGYGKRSTSEILFYQHLLGAIIAFPLLPNVILNSPTRGLFFGSLYAILVGFFATLLYFKGLKNISLSRAMPLTYAELLVALSMGIFVFGDLLTPPKVIGGILIMLSSLGTILINNNRRIDAEKFEHA